MFARQHGWKVKAHLLQLVQNVALKVSTREVKDISIIVQMLQNLGLHIGFCIKPRKAKLGVHWNNQYAPNISYLIVEYKQRVFFCLYPLFAVIRDFTHLVSLYYIVDNKLYILKAH